MKENRNQSIEHYAYAQLSMDTETGCGLPSTGGKARLLIGTAH